MISLRRWSITGRRGLKFISEMDQVETVDDLGVVFLLFALGLESSKTKLKFVGPVGVRGGLLQILFVVLLPCYVEQGCQRVFLLVLFLSMSSTAVVFKFLVERNSTSSLHGQVTIGILIYQDCVVGLLFALLPVLGGNSVQVRMEFVRSHFLVRERVRANAQGNTNPTLSIDRIDKTHAPWKQVQ